MTREQRIRQALGMLALARQAEWGNATARVYVDCLAGCHDTDVEAACRHLSTQPAPEFGPRMPEAGAIIEACRRRAQTRAEQRELRKLPPPEPRPEVRDQFLARIREIARKKAMPS